MFELPVYRTALVRDGTLRLPRSRVVGPLRAARLISAFIGDADREILAALFLDSERVPTGIQAVAMGTVDEVATTAREVFKGAMLANADAIVLGHNHTHGALEPSDADIRMTKAMIDVGIVVGIKVVDHIIVGPSGRFVSLRKKGVLAPDWVGELIMKELP